MMMVSRAANRVGEADMSQHGEESSISLRGRQRVRKGKADFPIEHQLLPRPDIIQHISKLDILQIMNPFTKYLSQWSSDSQFAEFVAYWDQLERVVIAVYRDKMTAAAAEGEFEKIWPWLRINYPAFEVALRPYWRVTRAAGQPTAIDPFRLLIDIESPVAITGDWRAMQHLPAAREAINRYLLENDAQQGSN